MSKLYQFVPKTLPENLKKITPKPWQKISIPFAYTVAKGFYDDYSNSNTHNHSHYKIYHQLPIHIYKQLIDLMTSSSQEFKTEADILTFLVKTNSELNCRLEELEQKQEQTKQNPVFRPNQLEEEYNNPHSAG